MPIEKARDKKDGRDKKRNEMQNAETTEGTEVCTEETEMMFGCG